MKSRIILINLCQNESPKYMLYLGDSCAFLRLIIEKVLFLLIFIIEKVLFLLVFIIEKVYLCSVSY